MTADCDGTAMKLFAEGTDRGKAWYTEQFLTHACWIQCSFLVLMMALINEISKAFAGSASSYERVALVQQEIGKRLFERLQYFKITPKRILDLGCGPGNFSRELALLFPKAQVVSLDLVHLMLLEAKKKRSFRCRYSLLAADMMQMPFPSGIFDLIFANQVIHWGASLPLLLRELNRVLQVNGCFMFTSLGPDTFKEIQTAWSGVNSFSHVNHFIDMHDLGDGLLAEYFQEPVMDMEYLTVHYESLNQLLHSLKKQGVKNIHPQRNRGLTSKSSWQQFIANYDKLQTESGHYPLTYEIVYGQAWKGVQTKSAHGVETFFPVTRLLASRTNETSGV
jgi:malonyl-CoA O-methyltransferase